MGQVRNTNIVLRIIMFFSVHWFRPQPGPLLTLNCTESELSLNTTLDLHSTVKQLTIYLITETMCGPQENATIL